MEKTDFKVTLPIFKDNKYYITDFGAVNDGYTNNSKAIEDTINHCNSNGGGQVVIPNGLWYTGPIELKSNIDLHLEKGAVLLFSNDYKDYPLINTNFEGYFMYRCKSPIYGKDLENVAITGYGVIDGNGDNWRPVKHFKMTEKVWAELVSQGGAVNNSGKEEVLWPSETNKEANKAFLDNYLLYKDKET